MSTVLDLISPSLLDLSTSSANATTASPCSLAKRLEICALEIRSQREVLNNCVPSDYSILEALAGGLILVGVEPSTSSAFQQMASYLETASSCSETCASSVASSQSKANIKSPMLPKSPNKSVTVQTRSKKFTKRVSPRRVKGVRKEWE
ncbi:hypothetical protein TL16_g12920 [Triparma laevis f. inornata]|uniref:Uncharacterized protein n=2 Tax=Triparma laevis TaxID=1534972 RepID=A0A9W6ZZ87_9STRA|nr:hypothetical protein TrLO_g13764 [Triparma laevis f. longispina]GMH94492.1 hypothetical protein TL16_g12920 [Triparma laevis f. inornata]